MSHEPPTDADPRPLRRARALALEADRAERTLRRLYPALARALGPRDVARLGCEMIRSHPFSVGCGVDFAALWPDFLAVGLQDDVRRGVWLWELARYEEALAWAARGVDAPRLACEHRVDELHAELLGGGAWQAPRPGRVVFAFERGRHGPRAALLRDFEARTPLPRAC
ncbi:MAG TPA: hypothetical protein VMT18_13890 [Planctomycetota bacterium]|nr:hypothetical protein [Planctomycetota bacterium]